MSSNELDHEPDHVQYVDEQEMRVVVGPSRSDNWNFRKEKSKSKLSRRKATLTRHINVAENLLKSRGSRRKLHELAAKIEEALKELERASEEYESFLELDGLQEHLTLAENAVERANLCLESIEISINERESELASEAGSEYAPSLRFESASGHGALSRASESERRARVMDLQVEQAKREAQRRLEEERKRAENLELERQLQEHRRIRELEYEAEKLRLEAQLDIPTKGKGDPEDIESRLRDFEDAEDETVYRVIKPHISENVEKCENPEVPSPQQNVKLPSPIKSSTLCKQTPQIVQAYRDTEERLNVSWIKELSAEQRTTAGGANLQSTPAFVKSILRLELPRFSGDPLEWPQFISLFQCLVHDQPLTDTQRMTYLQRALVGNAKRAIGGMLNHGHLYKAALTELEEQFGNEELVAGAFMKTVLDHPIVAEGDVTQLRSFYNTLHNAVATMKSLGYSHDLASSTNTRAALQKLPDLLKEKWGERKIEIHPIIPTLVDLDVCLRAKLRAKALVSEPLPSLGKPPKSGRSDYRRPPRKGDQGIDNRQEQLHRFSTLATGPMTGNQSLPAAKSFLTCSKKHKIEKCDKFLAMDVNQRAQLGKEKRLCFSCFESADHRSRGCSSKKRCDVEGCSKYHHTLIHGAAPVFVAPPPLNNAPPVLTLNVAASVFVGASSVNCTPSAVLLQIVPVAVATSSGVKVKTFALLDSGSQTSLILEKFADAIGLVGNDSPLQLGTINSSGEPIRSRKVSFHVGAVEGPEAGVQITVEEAWTIPQLNLPPQRVTRAMMQDFPHLTDLDIPEVDSEDVTILLGANVLEAILQRDVRRGRSGQPVAILTAFGWTLAGSVKSIVKLERLHVMHVAPSPECLFVFFL